MAANDEAQQPIILRRAGTALMQLDDLIREYMNASNNKFKISKSHTRPPFQFSLDVAELLYVFFDDDVKRKAYYYPHPRAEYRPPKHKKLARCDKKDPVAERKVPALAYYTWEAPHRLFLIRRVCPLINDFTYISYVPEGWGAMSIPLEQLERGALRHWWCEVKASDSLLRHRGLPFVLEKQKLKFTMVYIALVFRWMKVHPTNWPHGRGREIYNTANLLGAYVAFARRSISKRMANKVFRQACYATAKIQLAQSAVYTAPEKMGKEWKARWRDTKKKTIAALVCVKSENKHHRDEVARTYPRTCLSSSMVQPR